MPARNSGRTFIGATSMFAVRANWPMSRLAETPTPALNEASAISAYRDSRALGEVLGIYCVTRCSGFELTWAV